MFEKIVVQKDSQQKSGDSEPNTLEEMARQRDYKRRRQTYRAKNVHITKRSTVEVTNFSVANFSNIIVTKYSLSCYLV